MTAAKSLAGATRAKRSKRIHMRLVPATAGIDPTNVAVRVGGRGPALARRELGPQRRSLGLRAGGQREGEDERDDERGARMGAAKNSRTWQPDDPLRAG